MYIIYIYMDIIYHIYGYYNIIHIYMCKYKIKI